MFSGSNRTLQRTKLSDNDEHSFATQYELTQELAKRKKDAKKAKREAFLAQVFR